MQRRAFTVAGIVQGVGFRPFVYTLASQLQLAGLVQNRSGEVWIEVEGRDADLDRFTACLRSQAPTLSRIDTLYWRSIPAQHDSHFRILASEDASSTQVFVSPDVATCVDCRRELFDPSDRRYRYPFLNCTHCGPRLTIIHRAPYDRVNTTMATFAMCSACRAEYDDPRDRRFHAQPIACPDCGPRLQLLDGQGVPMESADPLAAFVAAIGRGKIGAMKGIGGYHLVCDATNDAAVIALRQRKHRDEKPFAVMVRDVDAAAQRCVLDDAERELLCSPRRPIVLLRKRAGEASTKDTISPGNPFLGVMLPYTPLHELLSDGFGDKPLVMTSGNRSDEPIAYDDRDAAERLSGIADVFLVHNRPIRVRCDDSVTRVIAGRESPVRRSRGDAPMPIKLPMACSLPCLAVGGQLKNVFALASGRNAFLSHHMGDLDHLAALESFQRDIELYESMFGIHPRCMVHDLHPDYASTTYALARAERETIPTLAVQHHHAHLASCMAEHQLQGEVIGVIFDGSGYGTDGTIWGGEFLVGGYESFQRVAHLRPVRLPGGDQATKEPWRMALSYLSDAGCDVEQWSAGVAEFFQDSNPETQRGRGFATPVSPAAIRVVRQMIDRGVRSPWTSSAGRLFDAVAAIAGVRQRVSFEGQAAIELESLATQRDSGECYCVAPCFVRDGEAGSRWGVDTRPLIRGVHRDQQNNVEVATIARRFHNTLATMVGQVCGQIAAVVGLDRVVLSGGVFGNSLFRSLVTQQLEKQGLRHFVHHQVPANDGGLSLGQLAIAARLLQTDARR